jgi:hypothetical protein
MRHHQRRSDFQRRVVCSEYIPKIRRRNFSMVEFLSLQLMLRVEWLEDEMEKDSEKRFTYEELYSMITSPQVRETRTHLMFVE